jgi:hypothetical protein
MQQKLFKNQKSGTRPSVFSIQNDIEQTTQYNFNITEGVDADGNEEFTYDCLHISYPLTRKNVFANLIEAIYPTSIEQKMQNDFIAKKEGIDENADQQPFIDFLNERKALRLMVINDCATHNIPEE